MAVDETISEENGAWHGPDQLIEEYLIGAGPTRVQIMKSAANSEIYYRMLEPPLQPGQSEEIMRLKAMISNFIPDLAGSSRQDVIDMERLIQSFMMERMPWIKGELKTKYLYYLNRDFNGYGIIDPIVRDVNIEDISCNAPGIPLFVFHNRYGSIVTDVSFKDSKDLSSYIVRLAQMCGKSVSVNSPLLDGITRDGHRVEAIYSTEISDRGPAFTLRLFRESPFTPTELIKYGTANPEMMGYLWLMVENLNSALIVGAPGSGKTSTLNSILMFAPQNTKIFSIEETRELNLSHQNWVAAETREIERKSLEGVASFGLFDLVKVAMRQRPTYIVVGEVRGREIYALFQAMATGHTTYSTIHADSMESLMNRLENEPMNVPKLMISYLNIVVFINFVKKGDKPVRRITEIDEITGIDPKGEEVTYNRVYYYDPSKDAFIFTGNSVMLSRIAESRDTSFSDVLEEIGARGRFLEKLTGEQNDVRQISSILSRYMGGNPHDA